MDTWRATQMGGLIDEPGGRQEIPKSPETYNVASGDTSVDNTMDSEGTLQIGA